MSVSKTRNRLLLSLCGLVVVSFTLNAGQLIFILANMRANQDAERQAEIDRLREVARDSAEAMVESVRLAALPEN